MNKETRNLIVFFLATFAATYATYFTIVLKGWSPYAMPGLALFLLGGSAPSWVGVLMVLFTYNKDQRRDYFRRCFSFKQIKGKWYAIIIFIFPLSYLLVTGLNQVLGGALPEMAGLKALLAQPWQIPLALLLGYFSGPFSEEFGWRGYSLDPLLQRFGRLAGPALLGFLWGVWHLGLFFMPQTWHGQMGFRIEGFWSFVLGSIGLSCVMAWVHLGTNRSIFAAMLMHLAYNFTSNQVHPYSVQFELLRTGVILVAGLALGILMERRSRQAEQPYPAIPDVEAV